MGRNIKKHTSDKRAAKVAGRFGWKLTDNEANAKACEAVPLRRVDSGNLARIADALERIAGYQKRVAEVMEREERAAIERQASSLV